MKSLLSFLQKFLKSFNEDPRGWGILLVLLLGLIGERYYHVHFKHGQAKALNASNLKKSEIQSLERPQTQVAGVSVDSGPVGEAK